MYHFDELVWYAFFIFYKDGTTDAIKISNYTNHIDYFNELRKISPLFASICDGIGFEFQDIPAIICRLVSMDSYVFLNFNLREILKDFRFVYRELPAFKIYGRHVESFETWKLLEQFISSYDLTRVGFQWMDETGNFQNLRDSWVDPEAVHMYVKNEYELLRIRSKENETKE